MKKIKLFIPVIIVVMIMAAVIAFVVYESSKPIEGFSDSSVPVAGETTTLTLASTNALTTTVTTTTNVSDAVDALADIKSELESVHKIESVPFIAQKPELPTGCEITSLTMVLNYWGYEAEKCDMAENYLVTYNGMEAKSFYDYFIGSPYDKDSFGCFAPVIVKTAQNYLRTQTKKMQAADISGRDFDDILHLVEKDYPIVIWSTLGLHDPGWTYYWSLEDGTEVNFPSYEHCVVLTGYDLEQNIVYINDPNYGERYFDRDQFEKIYEDMEEQAVLIF